MSYVSIRELLSATLPDVIDQIVDLAEIRTPGMPTLYPFCKYDEDPEERMCTTS